MDPKLEKAKNVIALLQEQFIDTKFILVTSEEDMQRVIEEQKKIDATSKTEEEFAEDFWSQELDELL